MENTFKREIDSLDKIFDFISEFSTQKNLDDATVFTVNLIIEELFTNMVKYHARNPHKVFISLTKDENVLTIVLIDYDVEPFDLTKVQAYDLNKPLKDRTPGKLGTHFIKKMMDNIEYDYKDRQSKITLTKYLRNE